MGTREHKPKRHAGTGGEASAKEHPERAPRPEHDQDSEPPRTARAPGADAIDEEWGRQEGC